MPAGSQIFRMEVLTRIKEVIKDNPGIQFDTLIVKLEVNDPFISEKFSKSLLPKLIKDKQVRVDEKGQIYIVDDDEKQHPKQPV